MKTYVGSLVQIAEQALLFAVRLLWASVRVAWPRAKAWLCWLSARAAIWLAGVLELVGIARRASLLSSRLFVAIVAATVWGLSCSVALVGVALLFQEVPGRQVLVGVFAITFVLGLITSSETFALVVFRFLTKP